MSNIKDRVLQLAGAVGIRKSVFCAEIGMTYGNFTGKAKDTPLNSSAIANILLRVPNVNPLWLLTGEGEMLTTGQGGIGSTKGQCEEIKNLSQAISDVSRALAVANQTILLQQEFIASNCKSENSPPLLSEESRLSVKCQTNEEDEEKV